MTPEKLRQYLILKDNGELHWRASNYGTKAGQAGWLDPKGYRRVQLCGQTYPAHWLVWYYVHGVWPKGQIDHINRIKDDNRIENLRDVTQEENQTNTGARATSKTGIKHIHPTRYSFRVKIKDVTYGRFKTLEQAQRKLKEIQNV